MNPDRVIIRSRRFKILEALLAICTMTAVYLYTGSLEIDVFLSRGDRLGHKQPILFYNVLSKSKPFLSYFNCNFLLLIPISDG